MNPRAFRSLPLPATDTVADADQGAPRCARRRLLLGALGALAALSTACGQLPMFADGDGMWAGTIAIRIDKSPLLLWTAQYRLEGDPRTGRLTLDDVSGKAVAQAQWTPEGASLLANGQTQQFDHRDRLATALFGEDMPMGPLIEWLSLRVSGQPTGWVVDASRRDRGVIWARRPATSDQPGILLTITRRA